MIFCWVCCAIFVYSPPYLKGGNVSSHLRFSLCLAKTLCWSREMLIIIAIACMCGVKSWVMSLLVACFFFGVAESTSSVFVEYAKSINETFLPIAKALCLLRREQNTTRNIEMKRTF